MSNLNFELRNEEPSTSPLDFLLKSTPGGDRPQKQDRTPLTEPTRPSRDGDSDRRQDEAELPGEGGTYDRD